MRRELLERPQPREEGVPLAVYGAVAAFVWVLCIAASLAWNIHLERAKVLEIAKSEARANFEKDQAFRLWAADRGGVYVPSDERTLPNPYLGSKDERDISTPSGRPLTLVNPAYMVRLVKEEHSGKYGPVSHLTSLRPLRPANAPDEWERRALLSFEDGVEEAFEITEIDGEPYMRLMSPLITDERCLECHAEQGYNVGDIRGGMSVSVPLRPLEAMHEGHINTMYLSHGIICMLGLLGIALGTMGIKRNILGRCMAEEKIVLAKQEWERTFDAIDDPVMLLDREFSIRRANKAMADKLGIGVRDAEGLTCYRSVHGTEKPIPECPHARLIEDGKVHTSEVYEERLGGHFLVSVSPIYDEHGLVTGSVHLAKDITELKRKEEQVRASLGEKEVLLKEVHHRVKNNMQIISSLNSLQTRSLQNEEALKAMQENRNRIRSMALVHERLYKSQSLSEVDAGEYIKDLVQDLYSAYGVDRMRVMCSIRSSVTTLNIDTLIPCGLIINELVTNALKYAFPLEMEGEIGIVLGRHGESILLTVSDNGVGISDEVNMDHPDTLGLRLVMILAKQLEGDVQLIRDKGTVFRVTLYEDRG